MFLGDPNLIPEEVFAARFSGPITIKVVTPVDTSAGSSAWGLNGQIVEVNVPVTYSIKEVKSTLTDLLGGMPATKQQLKATGGAFYKDTQTLAGLNIGEGAVIELSVKTRGGGGKK